MAHHFAESTRQYFQSQDIASGPAFRFQPSRYEDGTYQYGDTLLEIFEILYTAESSEPRDKTYAPMGFASDVSPSRIIPDHSKPLAEVYADVVRFSLSRPDHGLRVLVHIMHFTGEWKMLKTDFQDLGLPT